MNPDAVWNSTLSQLFAHHLVPLAEQAAGYSVEIKVAWFLMLLNTCSKAGERVDKERLATRLLIYNKAAERKFSDTVFAWLTLSFTIVIVASNAAPLAAI